MSIKPTIITLALLLSTAFSVSQAKAKEVDQAHQAAMSSAQKSLTDSGKRKEITDSNPQAKEVDKSVNDLTGSPEASKELYAISADILPVLMEMNQDNPEKALESLASYAKDPEAFMKQLPANIRLKIENLAGKIEKSKVKTKP